MPTNDLFKKLQRIEIYRVVRDVLIVAAIVGLVGVLTFVLRNSRAGPYRTEYAGKIVEKTIRLHESQEGSWAERYLTIEEEGGVRSQVVVAPSIYDRAKIGMWIKSRKEGIELSSPENTFESP